MLTFTLLDKLNCDNRKLMSLILGDPHYSNNFLLLTLEIMADLEKSTNLRR